MNGETEPTRRTPNRQQGVANLTAFLAQLRSSGSIHFWKVLPETALYHPGVKQTAKLLVPKQFVQDHGKKVRELVTLRVRTSHGRSSRSWSAHCCVDATLKVTIVGGWPNFSFDNRLKKGDFVVFVLRKDARSEFEIHVFRGPERLRYLPDLQEERPDEVEEPEEKVSSEAEKEAETVNPSRLAFSVRQQNEHNQQTFRGNVGEGNPAPPQQTGNPRLPPRFSKRLTPSNIRGPSGEFNGGQFEFPNRFIRNHGNHVHGSVKLQGIHDNSRNYVMPCRRRPRNPFKVYFAPADWSLFVRDNDLKEGQELQFSLIADSYFLVRKVRFLGERGSEAQTLHQS